MTRFRFVAALAICLAAASGPRAQDWRAPALASFDEAWQAIHDTFPDPAFGGVDWAGVARELRPKIATAGSADEARDVIREMLARLKRSHCVLLSATPADLLPGPATVPADVRIVGADVIVTRVTDPAATRAGLAPGQTIVAVDAGDLGDVLRKAEGSDSRTRSLDAWRRVNQRLYGADGSWATLSVREAGGSSRDVKVQRTLGAGEVVTLGNLPPLRVVVEQREVRTPGGRRVGVIWFSVWMTAVGDPFERAIDTFRKHDGLVIDLRGNPGGLAAMMRGIAGHVIDTPLLLGTMQTRDAKLVFTVNPRLATSDGRSVKPFAGPVAILVDDLTGSTSETFAGALQSLGRARIFGRPTMGQALPAMTRRLSNGDVLMYAVGDFVTATGKRLEGDGVIPDETVALSVQALAAGHDEPLEAALRWFDTVRRLP